MTAGTMRVLGGEVSPFTARARLALDLRGVAYELLDEPLGPKKSDRLLAANPVYGKIPVLLLPDGRAICESAVIIQCIEDVARGSGGAEASSLLLPDDPYERAMHRFWTAFIDDKVSTEQSTAASVFSSR
jgi:glutathione S-transferase